MSSRRRQRSQKRYENQWKEYANVQRYIYMMRLERIAMERKLTKIDLGVNRTFPIQEPEEQLSKGVKIIKVQGRWMKVYQTPL